MTTQKYTVSAYDCNGKQASKTIYARSMRGAKTQATAFASGSTVKITIDGTDGIATRTARDEFRGFCAGMNKWEMR